MRLLDLWTIILLSINVCAWNGDGFWYETTLTKIGFTSGEFQVRSAQQVIRYINCDLHFKQVKPDTKQKSCESSIRKGWCYGRNPWRFQVKVIQWKASPAMAPNGIDHRDLALASHANYNLFPVLDFNIFKDFGTVVFKELDHCFSRETANYFYVFTNLSVVTDMHTVLHHQMSTINNLSRLYTYCTDFHKRLHTRKCLTIWLWYEIIAVIFPVE